jgi:hypothetical protein
MSYDPHLLENRGDFKLHAAKTHLNTLKQLEDASPGRNLASCTDKIQEEMEIDEILYHLVGVKDALLQEINCELGLGLSPDEVWLKTINAEVSKKRPDARDITQEICQMESNEKHTLWLINELHNHSKHRSIIYREIIGIDSEVKKPSLIHPRTSEGILNDNGVKIPIVEYLDSSYKKIEELQQKVRAKIRQYHI